MNSAQLPLSLRWPSHQHFQTFVPGTNAMALDAVSHGDSWLFLHGAHGTGKTHLLIGACRAAIQAGNEVRYLPLASLPAPRAEAIASFFAQPGELLAVDDVQAVAGDADSERALFAVHNRARDAGARVLFAATAPPNRIGLALPDLVSRLSACMQCVLQPLDDSGRRAVLRSRAQQRGLEIDEAVLDWLFARQPRDLAALMDLFERVDHAAMAAQRRITIPFLREMLAESFS